MKKIGVILLLFYYTLGCLILPDGDFSVLPDLPKMYQHCQATEHQDMTVFDFITDHLLDIDGLFDAHDNDDEQKAHQPFPLHHSTHIQFYLPTFLHFPFKERVLILFKQCILPNFDKHAPTSEYWGSIFRPPILA
jgi:hypothetical protein